MSLRLAKLTTLSVIMVVAVFAATSAVQAADDAHGKDWRQLTETLGMTWSQVAQVCPQDGVTACVGSVGGVDLTDWVWATQPQVIELFSYFEPDILASPSLSGQKYFFSATNFLSFLRPTFSMTLTYQAAAGAAGWTASTDENGFPIVGSAGWGMTNVSIGGHFTLASNTNPDEVGSTQGIFLWRATGLGTTAAFAYDDVGQIPSPAGGTAVANVLANDWVAGAPATTANATLAQIASTSPYVTLNTSDGSVDVAAGVAPTTHTLVYRMCNAASPDNCDDAMVTVSVKAFVIDAVNDSVRGSAKTGGTILASVLSNDTLNGVRATTASVTLARVSLTPASTGITLDTSSGAVKVAPKSQSGTYALVYRICETADPTNCSQATVTIDLSGK